MSESRQVHVVELPDRYLVVDAETGENVEADNTGFSYASSAREWAEGEGYEVIE